ncbi:hypothetical protein P153DRAFT_353715 [Dothidotthia symphoricarpi CBS 119687]|uniref:Uncharacterized protein n=1 Tax=Dothidotthia symphoricarpi CBS 119687 TaxID=1392245 RepID=A0A6A6AN33_9PLEO|nr:uncharacterized protein P153DRAFT_353715 [Dothidotthia symphoricarpi CBS 119687]KAF2133339.1 hypothetical protein P153DRAFT_353715 [Dothidotthia symphoricarpi CBS 119687]
MDTPSQTCPILTSRKALPFDDLMAMASQYFEEEELTFNLNAIVNAVEERSSTATVEDQLAELIYFEEGRRLAAAANWNGMTRLQLEHEVLAQGLSDPNTIRELSDWSLRLKLAAANHESSSDDSDEGAPCLDV